jgi:hypothetical protein
VKKKTMAYLQISIHSSLGQTRENHEDLCLEQSVSGQGLNPGAFQIRSATRHYRSTLCRVSLFSLLTLLVEAAQRNTCSTPLHARPLGGGGGVAGGDLSV